MKFTLSWLKEYLETDASLDQIVDKLTDIGQEVEGVEDPAEKFGKFIVGHVEKCEKHPDADRLNVTTVNTGTEKIQVVCGAPNCKEGLKGIFAPSGTYVPGLDVTLKKTKIRGVESNGMLCSEKELCLSDEHKGIIELPADTEIGISAASALGIDDPVIDVGLTPNRGDCAGIYGMARDLASSGIGTLKPINIPKIEEKFDNPISVSIDEDMKESCPLFLGRYIKNVKNGDSPKWLQDKLTSIGLRPISTLVDITNYFCIGLNRPLHVYDANKIKGNLCVRTANIGEKLDALNDKTYELSDGMVAIADDISVLGLGGIMGGASTGCVEGTVNVYIECAYFDPMRTARTGRDLQIDSDARYRFERGIDPEFTADGMDLATQMILDLCGGEASTVCIAGQVPDIKKTIEYMPEKVKKLSGMDISQDVQENILTSLGFVIEKTNDNLWQITTPSWRHDICGTADFVEEILRVFGYDNIDAVPMPRLEGYQKSPLTPLQKRIINGKRVLASRGLNEAITWAFLSSDMADLFGANDDGNDKESVTLLKPLSSEWSVMRPSILPNLINAAQRNSDRGFADIALFEIGGIYHSSEYKGQKTVASAIRTGNATPKHWTQAERSVDVMDIKSDVLAFLESCNAPVANLQITRDAPSWYHPGRSGCLRLGKNVLACFGEIHPAILEKMDIDNNVMGFEVFMDNIPQARIKGTARKPLKILPLQALYRDFAFVVSNDVDALKVINAVKSADKKLIVDVDVFDVYSGQGVDEGHKSLAVTVTLQPVENTLTDAEIEIISQKVIQAVLGKTGGVLRGA